MRAALVNVLWQILECWKWNIRICCNKGTRALPEMYVRALGHYMILGMVCTSQVMHSCLCYNYYMHNKLKTKYASIFPDDINAKCDGVKTITLDHPDQHLGVDIAQLYIK